MSFDEYYYIVSPESKKNIFTKKKGSFREKVKKAPRKK